MDVNKELEKYGLMNVWSKLEGLPQAGPLELGAFCVIILFVATFLAMFTITCLQCCCCVEGKYQASRVEPLQPI